MKFIKCPKNDGELLADLRERAMRASLEQVGRYDPIRVRQRLLDTFEAENTTLLLIEEELVGFYVLLDKEDHLYLDHLYIEPVYQSKKYGSVIIKRIIDYAVSVSKPLRLCALKESRANKFYHSHGFVKTHECDFDNYYEFRV